MKKLAPNLVKIVYILNDGEFHAGSDIGKTLHITRSAVWKFISQLEHYGISIDSVKGKGYRLQQPLELLDAQKINAFLDTSSQAKINLSTYASVPSTNDYLKKLKTSNKDLTICIAEQQTAGRGRLQRHWHSPFATNIYFSCRKQFNKDMSELAGLSFVVSLAIVKTLEEFGLKKQLKLKWPNDVFWRNKKLAGSLIEINAESHGRADAIIGIGINVNMGKVTEDIINQPWTSLQNILGKNQDRNKIIASLIKQLITDLEQFEKVSLAGFIQLWHQYDYLFGKDITIKNLNTIKTGTAQGINKQGHLLLKNKDGIVHAYSSGDTSIVK